MEDEKNANRPVNIESVVYFLLTTFLFVKDIKKIYKIQFNSLKNSLNIDSFHYQQNCS